MPLGTRAQYTALHYSYQRPGESTPLVECVAPTGERHNVTGQAVLTFFVVAIAAIFVPAFLPNVVLALRRPQRQPARPMNMPTPPAARQAAPDETARRLERLEALRVQGVITAQEYEQKRKDILSSL